MTTKQDVWLAVYRDAVARQGTSMMPDEVIRDEAEEAANIAVDAFVKKFPNTPMPARRPDRA